VKKERTTEMKNEKSEQLYEFILKEAPVMTEDGEQ